MVHVLVQLPFVRAGMCTPLRDSGTWGLKAVYVAIFWKLEKEKGMNLDMLFLFFFSRTLCSWLFAESLVGQCYVQNISHRQSHGEEQLPAGRKALGTCAFTHSGSADSAGFSSIS